MPDWLRPPGTLSDLFPFGPNIWVYLRESSGSSSVSLALESYSASFTIFYSVKELMLVCPT
jgi:hypothetical protein